MKRLLAVLLFCATAAFAAGSATLSWEYTAAQVSEFGVTHFNMERKPVACAAAGAFAEVAQPSVAVRTYTDPNLTSGVTYCWRVAASGPGGKSPYSNSVEKFIPFGVPPAPGNLSVTVTISLNPETGKWTLAVQ